MRTTLSIDDDVLAAARYLAERQRKSVGKVISALARSALRPAAEHRGTRNGVPLLPTPKGRKEPTPATPELVRQLLDELP
jgi:hypothetical protein